MVLDWRETSRWLVSAKRLSLFPSLKKSIPPYTPTTPHPIPWTAHIDVCKLQRKEKNLWQNYNSACFNPERGVMGWKTAIYLPTLSNYLLLSAALWKCRLSQSSGCLAAHTRSPDAALLRSGEKPEEWPSGASRAIDQLRAFETSQWSFFWKTRTWLSSLWADESSLKLFWFCFDDTYIYILFFSSGCKL